MTKRNLVLILVLLICLNSFGDYEIKKDEDITYGKGVINADKGKDGWEESELKLDVWYPRDCEDKNKTLIMYIHGGGFSGTMKREIRKHPKFFSLGKYFVPKGYVVMSIEYRVRRDVPLFPEGLGWDKPLMERKKKIKSREVHAAIRDAKAAVRWVRAEGAERFGIDPQKICIVGTSAGAMTAVGVAVNRDDFLSDGPLDPFVFDNHPFESSRPNACFELAGLAFESLHNDFDPSDPPIAIWHGTNDKLVPVKYAHQLYKICKENNVPAELYIIENGGHVAWNDEYKGKKMMPIIEEFFERSLSEK